jgi:predicted  nucleic acid-binding Zn-ribbon protein
MHVDIYVCQEEDEEKCLVNMELERRAAKAEDEVKQKEEEVRQKEELISTLQRQVVHYESRLSECEVRMKSVEEELQRQITSLQVLTDDCKTPDDALLHQLLH